MPFRRSSCPAVLRAFAVPELVVFGIARLPARRLHRSSRCATDRSGQLLELPGSPPVRLGVGLFTAAETMFQVGLVDLNRKALLDIGLTVAIIVAGGIVIAALT
jgi:hypothetical protein